jgi:3-hydroxyisobutyrate dehydrogenase-like beta-hydroxyacid dehydrogenase
MTNAPTIGWIGLGKMGLPICERLRAAGYAVTVHAHSERSRASAKANGFAHVGRIADLADAADLIAAAVPDDPALLETVAGEGGLAGNLAARHIFVDMSTVSPEASSRVASLLAAKRAAYLRAPVSGSTAAAAAGALTSIVSGPHAVYDRLEPFFAAFTRKTFHVGEREEARFLKLAINGMVGATSALLAEALALAGKGGVSAAAALEVIGQSAVASPVIGYKRDMIVKGDYTANFTVEQMMKDFDILLSVGRAVHAPLPLAAQIRQQYEAAWLNGKADRDFFVLVQELAELARLTK